MDTLRLLCGLFCFGHEFHSIGMLDDGCWHHRLRRQIIRMFELFENGWLHGRSFFRSGNGKAGQHLNCLSSLLLLRVDNRLHLCRLMSLMIEGNFNDNFLNRMMLIRLSCRFIYGIIGSWGRHHFGGGSFFLNWLGL